MGLNDSLRWTFLISLVVREKGKKYKLSFWREYVPLSGEMIHLPQRHYEE